MKHSAWQFMKLKLVLDSRERLEICSNLSNGSIEINIKVLATVLNLTVATKDDKFSTFIKEEDIVGD